MSRSHAIKFKWGTTVEAKSAGSGSSTETVDEDEGLPGFGAISALAALGVALILRRRL